ncbi:hypothetical protein [Pseudonocardia spinosispora]|uniref:hypothetical protein n=1 Tax=Pseudonocardia spinosispora TaxID=103441 RepID=UPI0003F85787|nr:hypothetical protein [Pseudonocardia spinosispora]
MATTWLDLIGYVRVRYEIFQQTDRTLRFHLPTEGDRTQRVAVHHLDPEGTSDESGWIMIESAIAKADDVDLRRLLELAGKSVVGGVVIADGVALFRHSASLSDMSLGGFDQPFQLVVKGADALEHELTGEDRF